VVVDYQLVLSDLLENMFEFLVQDESYHLMKLFHHHPKKIKLINKKKQNIKIRIIQIEVFHHLDLMLTLKLDLV